MREVARAHGVSKTWLYELIHRYEAGGVEGLVPRSRRPHRSPTRVRAGVEDEIVMLRKHLAEEGLDAGPDTIHSHLAGRHRGRAPCSVSTVWRILTRRGLITPQPHKRPTSSYVRFEASSPNECWQMDVTHVELASGRGAEVLNVIDDHSRLCVASRAFRTTTAADVVATFYVAAARYLPGHFAYEREHRPHDFVAGIGGWLKHAWTATVDDRHATLPAVPDSFR